MKKQVLLFVLIIILASSVLALTACHEHKYDEWVVAKQPTCTQDGQRERFCTCGEKQTASISATGHTEVVDAAVEPSCSTTGLTKGEHCSVCGEVIVTQKVVDAVGHTEVIDSAVSATCTDTGLTEGKHCSVCDEVIAVQQVVEATGHTEVVDQAVAATCTNTGLTEGKHCSVCKQVLVAQERVAALGHDPVEHSAQAPTCTEVGWDDHIDCSRCDYSTGIEIPATGHRFADGVCTICFVQDPMEYTWNSAPSTIPNNWNPFTHDTFDATYILDYSTDTLYAFDYNQDGTGYTIVPSMAAAMPVDVSHLYAERFGYASDLVGKAYKIVLRDNLKYDNGDAITAHSFVESVKRLLDSKANNMHALQLIDQNLKILGAKEYSKSGTFVIQAVSNYYDGITTAYQSNANLYLDKRALDECFLSWIGLNFSQVINIGYHTEWFQIYTGEASNRVATTENFMDKWILPLYNQIPNNTSTIEINWTPEQFAQMVEDFSNCDAWNPSAESELAKMLSMKYTFPVYDFSDVGFFAEDDHTLVIVFVDAMPNDFWLKYALVTNFYLVHTPTYDACSSMVNGVFTNNYGTSIDTYVGYGPYKLVDYVADQSLRLERNLHWHGYSQEELKGQYQTTAIQYTAVTDDEIRLQMFLAGQLEEYALRDEDIEKYGNSKYTYYDEMQVTWMIAMNPDADNLADTAQFAYPQTTGNTVIKQPLAIDEFRQALSYSLDRAAFCLALQPSFIPAKGALSNSIIYDPELGIAYRSTDEAKDALLAYWGLSDAWGAGKKYATRDEAIASITGRDLDMAKVLFTRAYEIAVENGWIPSGNNWELQIMVGASRWESAFYSNAYRFLQSSWTVAVKDTPWEGHLTFVRSESLGNDWPEALRTGVIDMLVAVGWGADTFDPYRMLQSWVRDDTAYDTFTDKDAVMVDIQLDGKLLRASLTDWLVDCLSGEAIEAHIVGVDGQLTGETVTISAGEEANSTLRIKILAACEAACLKLYNTIPLMTDATAFMRSHRISFPTENWIFGVGHGGIKYYTYTLTDAEWESLIMSSGGKWNYTATE